MKKVDWTKWSSIAEILSAIAIVITLAYLAIQTRYVSEQTALQNEQNAQNIELLRQSRDIAANEAFVTLESSAVAARDAINLHAEIWERGAAGQELSPSEAVIFDNLVFNLGRQAMNAYFINLNFRTEEEAIRNRNDFAIDLYRNPGARRSWQAWEEETIRYRQILEPEISGLWTTWYEDISASLNALDSANE